MRTTRLVPWLAFAGVLVARAAAAAPAWVEPVDHDHIAYVRPYAAAVRRAQEERRILIVRPFPVGGAADGSRDGRWCPLADYMRAVTLSDETVITLVNRRFVFTYFSLIDWADLSDPEAKRAITRLAPEYGAKVRGTPPTFFLAPDGTRLATLDTMASPRDFLAMATGLLAAYPDYAQPTPAEADLTRRAAFDMAARLALGRLQLELGDGARATRTLQAVRAGTGLDEADLHAEALVLLARHARLAGHVVRAARLCSELDELPAAARHRFDLDLRVERAHLHALAGAWSAALRAWTAIEAARPSPDRLAEVLYWKGVGYYHLGRRRDANHAWVRVLEELPEGRYYQPARLAAIGPTYGLASPDLARSGTGTITHWRSRVADPSRLPGSALGYGTSTRGHAGTDETPERLLQGAYRDYHDVERRRAARPRLAAP